MEAGQGRGPPTNQQTSSSQVWLVALQVIIQPHASFYVAFLAAPVPRWAISEGIISWSMWHYRCMLYSHKKLTCLANVSELKRMLVLPWYLIIDLTLLHCQWLVQFLALPVGFFMWSWEVHYYVWTSSLDSRLAHVVIYEGCLRHLRHEASGVIVMPHYSCS